MWYLSTENVKPIDEWYEEFAVTGNVMVLCSPFQSGSIPWRCLPGLSFHLKHFYKSDPVRPNLQQFQSAFLISILNHWTTNLSFVLLCARLPRRGINFSKITLGTVVQLVERWTLDWEVTGLSHTTPLKWLFRLLHFIYRCLSNCKPFIRCLYTWTGEVKYRTQVVNVSPFGESLI